MKGKELKINAQGIHYQPLNEQIQTAVRQGYRRILLDNVCGQRYIGAGLEGTDIEIIVNGIPGNDLAAFMDGPAIIVRGNGQDGIGNTMNAGKIIVHGDAGDIAGHAMRGGRVYIKGDVGYRVGIHMKSYKELYPVIIAGGRAGDFLGEYMAGGLIIILGRGYSKGEPAVGNYCGTGMHGGMMYIRGDVQDYQLGREVKKFNLEEEDKKVLHNYLKEYCAYFSLALEEVGPGDFKKLVPGSRRPYGKLYAY